jgi:hypothetical protein
MSCKHSRLMDPVRWACNLRRVQLARCERRPGWAVLPRSSVAGAQRRDLRRTWQTRVAADWPQYCCSKGAKQAFAAGWERGDCSWSSSRLIRPLPGCAKPKRATPPERAFFVSQRSRRQAGPFNLTLQLQPDRTPLGFGIITDSHADTARRTPHSCRCAAHSRSVCRSFRDGGTLFDLQCLSAS